MNVVAAKNNVISVIKTGGPQSTSVNWKFLSSSLQFCSFIYGTKLPQPGNSEGTFAASSQIVTCCYQSNHLKVEATLLSALPKDTTNELAGLSSHYPFNAESQVGKL